MRNKLIRLKGFEYIAVAVLFASLGAWQFWPAFITPNSSIAEMGDGLGAMPWFEVLRGILESEGFIKYITTPLLENRNIGEGLMPASIPWSSLWRIAIYPLIASNLDIQDVYDAWIFLIYILNAVAGYFLARVLGAGGVLSLFIGLLCAGLDNYGLRILAHNTLAANFGVLFQLSIAVLAGKSQSGGYLVRYGVASWLSFQVNEYYGYYGLIFSSFVIFGFWLMQVLRREMGWANLKKATSKGVLSFSVFFVLMTTAYPSIILGMFGFYSKEILQSFSHSVEALQVYSVLNPLQLFAPFWSREEWGNSPEFTYRVGLAPIVIPILAIAFTWFGAREISGKSAWRGEIAVFAAAGLLMSMIGLHPSYKVSLGELFFAIAPTFRVTTRAYLLVDIAIISIICLSISRFWLVYKRKNILFSTVTVFLFCFLVYVDLYKGWGFRQHPLTAMPEGHFVFDGIDMDDGKVLELPFYSPYEPPENSYRYAYHWSKHKRQVLNAPFNRLNETNRPAAEKIDGLSEDLRHLDESLVRKLGGAGVKYILANTDRSDYSYLSKIKGLQLVREHDYAALYEISNYTRQASSFPILLAGYPDSGQPDYNIKLSEATCRTHIKLNSKTSESQTPDKEIALDVSIKNESTLIWGENGADVRLGAIWVEAGREGSAHEPNYGERVYLLKKTVAPGESSNLKFSLSPPSNSGKLELWLSLMQPGTIWCFHTGIEPFKIPVILKE